MASSVEICNTGLAYLGAEGIAALDGSTKTTRACRTFYPQARDYLLSLFDWPFARKLAKLEALDTTEWVIPSDLYAYTLPADCLVPRSIYPRGTRTKWEVQDGKLLTSMYPTYLYYTRKVETSGAFSVGFVEVLSVLLASKLCMPITADKSLADKLRQEFSSVFSYVTSNEANIGNEWVHHDLDPDADRFVNPDGDGVAYVEMYEGT